MIDALLPYKDYVKTITSDNGLEFSEHQYISKKLKCDFYFANPYCSWVRGLSENTNGLVRQYISKDTYFEKVSKEKILHIRNQKYFYIFASKSVVMNIFSFTAHFGTEEDCRNHFKAQRDKIGVVCKKCSGTAHYWHKSIWTYECKNCKSRTSLRSGTIMQSSNLSFSVWYKTMFLMSCSKKGFSAKEIQKQLGLKRYEPVWAMVHKLRKAMGNRDKRYTLEDMIELDEGYFTV